MASIGACEPRQKTSGILRLQEERAEYIVTNRANL